MKTVFTVGQLIAELEDMDHDTRVSHDGSIDPRGVTLILAKSNKNDTDRLVLADPDDWMNDEPELLDQFDDRHSQYIDAMLTTWSSLTPTEQREFIARAIDAESPGAIRSLTDFDLRLIRLFGMTAMMSKLRSDLVDSMNEGNHNDSDANER